MWIAAAHVFVGLDAIWKLLLRGEQQFDISHRALKTKAGHVLNGCFQATQRCSFPFPAENCPKIFSFLELPLKSFSHLLLVRIRTNA